jgi:hypothetical protein
MNIHSKQSAPCHLDMRWRPADASWLDMQHAALCSTVMSSQLLHTADWTLMHGSLPRSQLGASSSSSSSSSSRLLHCRDSILPQRLQAEHLVHGGIQSLSDLGCC